MAAANRSRWGGYVTFRARADTNRHPTMGTGNFLHCAVTLNYPIILAAVVWAWLSFGCVLLTQPQTTLPQRKPSRMKTPHAVAALLGLAVIVSACMPDDPTTPDVVRGSSSGPGYDGGVMYGSGNAASTETQTAADSSGAAAAGRGGVMYGSGN